MKVLTPSRRRWLYGVCAAALPLCVALGWLQPEVLPLLLPLVTALLNVNPEDTHA